MSPLGRVEFGLVEEVLDAGRNLKIKVARAHTKDVLVRELVADSRNCYLIHREEEESLEIGGNICSAPNSNLI